MQPALKGARIENARYVPTVGPDGVDWRVANPEEIKLVLPPVDHQLREQLGKNFSVRVWDYFEDERALATRFRFNFDVTVKSAQDRPDGLLDLFFTARLEAFGNET